MSKLYKYSVFFLSYAPLWVSILFIDMVNLFLNKTSSPWTERISITLIIIFLIIALLIFALTLSGFTKEIGEKVTLLECAENKTTVIEYMLSCVLPMLAFDFTLWTQTVLFLIYFVTLGYLCIIHNILAPNIVLDLMKYRSYHVKIENNLGNTVEADVLSREELINKIGNKIGWRQIGNKVYYSHNVSL